ncbi:iron-sulfur cluster assembly scaffold protein [Thermodesulfobacteriota bacterium]
MDQLDNRTASDSESIRELLSGSGYSGKAIDYYLDKTAIGCLPDADQETELTGPCGDTMKIYLRIENGRVNDAKFQVLGCPGAIAAAMATAEIVRGKTIEDAVNVKDRDIFRLLEEIPDQKQHCIRLAVKTLQKAISDYGCKGEDKLQGE